MTKPQWSQESANLICKNVVVSGRRTSIRMERAFWRELDYIAMLEDKSIHDMITMVNERQGRMNLTAALRVFIVCYLRSMLEKIRPFLADAPPAPVKKPERTRRRRLPNRVRNRDESESRAAR